MHLCTTSTAGPECRTSTAGRWGCWHLTRVSSCQMERESELSFCFCIVSKLTQTNSFHSRISGVPRSIQNREEMTVQHLLSIILVITKHHLPIERSTSNDGEWWPFYLAITIRRVTSNLTVGNVTGVHTTSSIAEPLQQRCIQNVLRREGDFIVSDSYLNA